MDLWKSLKKGLFMNEFIVTAVAAGIILTICLLGMGLKSILSKKNCISGSCGGKTNQVAAPSTDQCSGNKQNCGLCSRSTLQKNETNSHE